MPNDPDGRPSRNSPDLLVVLDATSARPLREQLAEALKGAVRTGRLAAGTRLPSTRALAEDLGVSRGVVVDAYAQLVAEGYFSGHPGSGTHVGSTVHLLAAPPVPQQAPVPVETTAVAFDLRADRPDLSLFPRRNWVSATRDAVRDLGDDDLGWPGPSGAVGLRAELASYLGRVRGAMAMPDDLVIVAGVTQGLALLAKVLAARGHDTLAVEDPSGLGQHRAVAGAELRLVPIPVDRDGLDVAALAGTGARAVLCAPTHQFPTGAVLSAPRRAALVRWAQERDGIIVEDDRDAVFRWDRMPMSCLQGLDPQRIVLLGSVSLSLAPALRLGWIVPPAALLEPLVVAKREADGGSPIIGQEALARLIEMGAFDRHLRRARKIYRPRRDALLAAVGQQLPDWTAAGAAAGLHIWLQPPGVIDAAALVAAVSDRGILVEAVAAGHGDVAPLAGLVVSFARLTGADAPQVVSLLAEAIAEVGSAPASGATPCG